MTDSTNEEYRGKAYGLYVNRDDPHLRDTLASLAEALVEKAGAFRWGDPFEQKDMGYALFAFHGEPNEFFERVQEFAPRAKLFINKNPYEQNLPTPPGHIKVTRELNSQERDYDAEHLENSLDDS